MIAMNIKYKTVSELNRASWISCYMFILNRNVTCTLAGNSKYEVVSFLGSFITMFSSIIFINFFIKRSVSKICNFIKHFFYVFGVPMIQSLKYLSSFKWRVTLTVTSQIQLLSFYDVTKQFFITISDKHRNSPVVNISEPLIIGELAVNSNSLPLVLLIFRRVNR